VLGLVTWLFDGLDELYAGDREFFDYLLDFLTARDSKAQIVICARDSLLTSCDTFRTFMEEVPGQLEGQVRLYRLNDWGRDAKRAYAWLQLHHRLPAAAENDPGDVRRFLSALDASPTLKSMSGLPYYCALLFEDFQKGRLGQYADEFDLLEGLIGNLIKREEEKGLVLQRQIARGGAGLFACWSSTYGAIDQVDVEQYAELTLADNLSPSERRNAVTSLVQFPFSLRVHPRDNLSSNTNSWLSIWRPRPCYREWPETRRRPPAIYASALV